MADPGKQELIDELRRRHAGNAEKMAMVEELASRHGITSSPSAPKERSWMDEATDFAKGAILDTGKGIAHAIGRLVPDLHPTAQDEALRTILGPAGPLFGDIVKSHIAEGKKAYTAFKAGENLEGAGHAVAAALPMVGPAAAAIGESAAETNPDGTPKEGAIARAAGQAAGLALAPEVAKRLPSRLSITPKNPVEAAAVKFGMDNDVPLSMGAATGNRFIQGAQTAADLSPIGSVISENTKAGQAAALRHLGNKLADEAHPVPIVPEQAGEGIQSALKAKSARFGADAEQNYGPWRNTMESSSATRMVPVNGKMEPIQAPVPIASLKQSMEPIFNEMEMMPAAQKSASAGYNAIKELLDGPDVVPATTAELALSYFKEMARDASGRNQGIAKQLVSRLQPLVDSAVKNVSQTALDQLRAGREATRMQKGVQEVERTVRAEPVQAYGQAIYSKDAGIEHLRRLEKEVPGEMPKIGRAVLEDILQKATFEGGFDKMDSALSKWRDMGPETKRIIFKNPMLIEDLDKFFMLAKKAGHDFNPSGSAKLGGIMTGIGYIFADPISGAALVIGTGALSKLLHSPAAVRALTEGFRVPIRDAGRAASVATRIKALVGDAAKPLDKAAQRQAEEQEAQRQP